MTDSLDDYRKKRDFGATPEPAPDVPVERAELDGPPVFVVHRHEARNLHYDLRLEMEGVLRSWAVPKGFSYDPSQKRLAVRTEDHPLEYEHFDGMIPEGQYGAGAMTIWDRGRYEVLVADDGPSAVRSGEVKVLFYGRKLRGEWHMVKTNGGPNHWLLFKSKDRYAGDDRDTALRVDLASARSRPIDELATLEPMRPAQERNPFSAPDWLFEVAFEGRRTLVAIEGDTLRAPGLDAAIPGSIQSALRRVRAEETLLDGVFVALDADERPSRAALDAALADEADGVVFYAFDLLSWNGLDLCELPLVDRKRALRDVLPPDSPLLFVDHVFGDGERLCAVTEEAGLAGVVAKRAAAPYTAGASDDWVRIPLDDARREGTLTEALARAYATSARASRVQLSTLDKVFWPAEGLTKGGLIAYYDAVADLILPYLRERPVHMNRFPDGIEGKSFYQREAKEHTPDWIETEPIVSDSKEGPVPHLICNDRDTLLWIANAGSIDLHPWLSRRGSLDEPDWMVLDLDPKEAPFAHVVRIARAAGKLLFGIGLRPLVKTSGASGLHVYVPLAPGYTYDQSRMFCEGVARALHRDLKDISTVERAIGSRGGKVYLDFGQNRKSQTIVPPYSVRPVPGAQVSTPLSWDELDASLSPSSFTIENALERFERLGDLFRPALTDPQDLMEAAARLTVSHTPPPIRGGRVHGASQSDPGG